MGALVKPRGITIYPYWPNAVLQTHYILCCSKSSENEVQCLSQILFFEDTRFDCKTPGYIKPNFTVREQMTNRLMEIFSLQHISISNYLIGNKRLSTNTLRI